MTAQTLADFEAEIRKLVPDFKVCFKDDSKLQRVIGFLVWIFNREYMTKYTTTLYPVVWFPTRDFYESRPRASLNILAHELVHLLDTQKHPFWFRLGYLFPQVLSLLAFLAIIPTAILAGWWAFLALGIALVLLVPWPAPWRTAYELRGYGMSLAIIQWSYGIVAEDMPGTIADHFTKADYYFMSWSRTAVVQKLTEYMKCAKDGTLQQEDPYKLVRAFLAKNNLVA